jgi:FG-GAP-like repeat
VITNDHRLHIIVRDASLPEGAKLVRTGIDINNGISSVTYCNRTPDVSEYGGGPPTVADFDGDGIPDVGVAGAVGYIAVSGKKLMDLTVPADKTPLWFKTTRDCSSAVTGSAVFDFNGDGRAEVVYSDEYHLWMYDGLTGDNLIAPTCNTTGTLYEYPVVADVDNDGQADIVVASNAYAFTCPDGDEPGKGQSGIRVFGSASSSWVRTRRVWNQHTYHVTNVNEDGTIPKNEAPNWTTRGLNNFRQNKQPGSEFAAADLVVELAPACDPKSSIVATVRNIGEATAPAGVEVAVYDGPLATGKLVGTAMTTRALAPAQGEPIVFTVTSPVKEASAKLTAPKDVLQCRTQNDSVGPVSMRCNGVN